MIEKIKQRPKLNLENSVYLLLFLFPLFAIGVRHWSSVTFSLLIITGLVYYFSSYRKDALELHKHEKMYLWFLVVYFIVFLLSMLLHYPDSFGDTQFGNEIRFLLVIPLYLLLTRVKYGVRWLAYGAAVSIFISLGFCFYDLYVIKRPLFRGEYSQLFTGPIILIYLALVLGYFIPKLGKKDLFKWLLLATLVIIATYCIIATEARSAYLGYMPVMLLLLFLSTKGWIRITALPALICIIIVIGINSQSVTSRVSLAVNEVVAYFEMDNHAESSNRAAATSAGTRLEMWRASYLFVTDYPLLGAGNGNYQKKMKGYAEEGLVHPATTDHSHPHNIFVYALMSKGLLGLACALLVFFFPLYIYLSNYRKSASTAGVGILFVTAMFFVSMTAAAPFNKSNFVATYLILSLVIFQNHMQAVKKKLAT